MATVTIRDLRTRFPKLKQLVSREGEVVVTDRGRPAYVLRAITPPKTTKPPRIDYYQRLKLRQPRPLPRSASEALDEANRGDR